MDGPYLFPAARLLPLQDNTKTPLIFVACGSFSPITHLHLRMFEMARDYAKQHCQNFQVVGAYLSLVNGAYKKAGLAPSVHRYNMCNIACQETSDWIDVDPWEARQKDYVPTARVLDHFQAEINDKNGGVLTVDGQRKKARVVLLAGSDLIQTMSVPGVWSTEDLEHILGQFGCYIVERPDADIDQSIFSTSRSPLSVYRHNIWMVPQLVRNDVSSTKIRLFVRKGMSVEYLLPRGVVQYIQQNGLYRDTPADATSQTGASSIAEKMQMQ